MPIDARPTLAAPDDDPYLWLEDIDGPRALQWVEAQTAETLRRFGSERFARDRDVLTALWDRPDRIPNITRRGGLTPKMIFLQGRELAQIVPPCTTSVSASARAHEPHVVVRPDTTHATLVARQAR